MNGSPFVVRGVQRVRRHGMSMALLVTLALMMLGGGVHWSVAQSPPWPRVIENPAAIGRTLSADIGTEPEGEGVWVSSDASTTRTEAPSDTTRTEAPSDTTRTEAPSESQTSQAQQAAGPEPEPRMPGLSDIPKISEITSAILRIRPPKIPDERNGAARGQADQTESVPKDAAKTKPAANHKPILRLKLEAGLPRETSPLSRRPETPERDANKPIVPELSDVPTVSDFTAAVLKVRVPKLPMEVASRVTDDVQKAESALRPDVKPEPPTKSLRDTLASIRRVTAERREPEAPPEAPAALNLSTEKGDEELFHTTSAPVKPAGLLFESISKPSEASLTDGAPAPEREGASKLRLPVGHTYEPDAQTPLLAGKLAAGGPIEDTTRVAPATSLVGITTPPMWRAAETRGAFSPVLDGAGPPRPDAPPDDTARTPGVRQVVLRMKLAEFNRAAERQRGLLEFYRDPSLLRSLMRAEAGKGAVVLDSPDTEKMETELEALTKRGTLRIRSEPTLVTRSGQVATFSVGGNPAESATETETHASGKDLRVAVTLLPVVTEDDHVRLTVTSKLSGSDAPSTDAGEHSPTAQISTTEVRMHPGQTLAIGGLRRDEAQAGAEQHLPPLSQILGIGTPAGAESELIVLITPELTEPAQARAQAAASVAEREEAEAAEGEVRWPEIRRTADRRLWPLRL